MYPVRLPIGEYRNPHFNYPIQVRLTTKAPAARLACQIFVQPSNGKAGIHPNIPVAVVERTWLEIELRSLQ